MPMAFKQENNHSRQWILTEASGLKVIRPFIKWQSKLYVIANIMSPNCKIQQIYIRKI